MLVRVWKSALISSFSRFIEIVNQPLRLHQGQCLAKIVDFLYNSASLCSCVLTSLSLALYVYEGAEQCLELASLAIQQVCLQALWLTSTPFFW